MAETIEERTTRIKLVLTDSDGVLTDGGVFYDATGEVMKCFHARDGHGFQRLQLAGIVAGIVTGEHSPSVKRYAEQWNLPELHLGIKEKLPVVQALARSRGLTLSEVAYLGDDVNDLEVLKAVGLAACPADAFFGVFPHVQLVLETCGGHGAFYEFAETILRHH